MNKFINSKYVKVFIVMLMLVFFIEIQAVTVQADFGTYINNQFSNEVSVQTGSPGYYHSQGADIYTLGYTRIRFGTQSSNFSLFAIQPPSFSLGCSGIDAMWGGFEMMIKNLLKVLKNIMAIAPEFAFDIALGVLCKQCESIMNQLESIANKLNGLNFNSCRTAQAASNIAIHGLSKVLNLNAISGATNSWASGVSGALSDISKPIGSFITNVNQYVNCNATTGGKKYVKWGGSCGEKVFAKKFGEGSLLLKDLKHAHLGIGAFHDIPGTGGSGDIIGILRGSVLGDVIGYLPKSQGKQGSAGVIKYHPIAPEWGTSSGSSIHNYEMSFIFKVFLEGGKLTSININWSTKDANKPMTFKSMIEDKKPVCFYGFENLYESYLYDVYNAEFPKNVITMPAVTTDGCSTKAKFPNLTAQGRINFISSSSIPVVLIMKMAYVNHTPDLIKEAANVMAISALYHWLMVISDEAALNIYTADPHPNSKSASVPSYLTKFSHQINLAVKYIQTNYNNQLSKVDKLMNELKVENLTWTLQLSNDGLLGAYDFSSHSK